MVKQKRNIVSIVCFVGCLGLTQWAIAQDEVMTTNLRVAALKRIGNNQLYYADVKNPDEKKPFLLSTSNMLAPVRYKGSPNIQIFTQKGVKVADVTLKPKLKQTLLLLLNTDYKRSYKAYVLNCSFAKFEMGGKWVFNLSPYKIHGQWGGNNFKIGDESNTKFTLNSLKHKQLTSHNKDAAHLKSQPVVMFYAKEGKAKLFYSTSWFQNMNQRQYVFVYTKAAGAVPMVKCITEGVQKKKNPK